MSRTDNGEGERRGQKGRQETMRGKEMKMNSLGLRQKNEGEDATEAKLKRRKWIWFF